MNTILVMIGVMALSMLVGIYLASIQRQNGSDHASFLASLNEREMSVYKEECARKCREVEQRVKEEIDNAIGEYNNGIKGK
jgi:hypothetical protein